MAEVESQSGTASDTGIRSVLSLQKPVVGLTAVDPRVGTPACFVDPRPGSVAFPGKGRKAPSGLWEPMGGVGAHGVVLPCGRGKFGRM